MEMLKISTFTNYKAKSAITNRRNRYVDLCHLLDRNDWQYVHIVKCILKGRPCTQNIVTVGSFDTESNNS